jgi:hypothetical protein
MEGLAEPGGVHPKRRSIGGSAAEGRAHATGADARASGFHALTRPFRRGACGQPDQSRDVDRDGLARLGPAEQRAKFLVRHILDVALSPVASPAP